MSPSVTPTRQELEQEVFKPSFFPHSLFLILPLLPVPFLLSLGFCCTSVTFSPPVMRSHPPLHFLSLCQSPNLHPYSRPNQRMEDRRLPPDRRLLPLAAPQPLLTLPSPPPAPTSKTPNSPSTPATALAEHGQHRRLPDQRLRHRENQSRHHPSGRERRRLRGHCVELCVADTKRV